MIADCCCYWGCAVSGEHPEFECYRCPVHGGPLAQPWELCKRHKRESQSD